MIRSLTDLNFLNVSIKVNCITQLVLSSRTLKKFSKKESRRRLPVSSEDESETRSCGGEEATSLSRADFKYISHKNRPSKFENLKLRTNFTSVNCSTYKMISFFVQTLFRAEYVVTQHFDRTNFIDCDSSMNSLG